MNVQINQITPRRENGQIKNVLVHFTASTADGNIHINGSVPVEETTGLIDFSGIEQVVKQELVNRLMNGDLGDAE